MKRNVIILTSGLSGSSVLTGLIARAGYWTGESTFKKADYDTFENQELIDLNLRLFREAGYRGNYLLEYSPEAIRNVGELYGKIDCAPYRALIEHCNQHEPWIWKDPRLWLTIRFWKNLLDLDSCCFIILSRGLMQSWISSLLRRQITTYRYSKAYETKIVESAVKFAEETRVPSLRLTYEGLIMRPAETLESLNRFLGSNLSLSDLQQTYHKPLYKSPRSSIARHVKAMMIYAKNYSERLDIAG
jgi:hypothetical protein